MISLGRFFGTSSLTVDKRLLDLLQEAKPIAIQCWAECHGCQIKPLAAAVLEALQFWPNTLTLIGKLCLAETFRDALLDVDPSFHSLLLDTSNGSNPPPAGLENACIQMLSYPLPASYATPASTHSLCSRFVQNAVASPSVSTFRSLYSVLAGVGTDYLKSMPSDLIIDLHQTLTRSLKSMMDHTASLLCLAVLARLCPRLPETTSKETYRRQMNFATRAQDQPLQLRHLFVGKRACNALELAILQAIIACSEKSDDIMSARLEVLRLAIVIVEAIDTEDRLMWTKRSTHFIQKLHDRIFCRELDEALRLTGFELWTALTGGCQLNTSDEDIMTIETTVNMCPQVRQQNSIITTCCGRFSTSFIKSQLIRALETAMRARNSCTVESMLELKTATWVIESFMDAVKAKNKLRKAILTASACNDVRTLLQGLLAPGSDTLLRDLHQDSGVCIAQASAAVQMLQKKLCTLFLLSSLHSTFDDVSIDPTLASNMLRKIQEASIPPPKCNVFQSCSRSSVKVLSLVQISGTPSKETGNWRDRLLSELSHEAIQAQSRTIRFIHDVCQDLEERCNNVEHPLRKEQARSLELEKENGRLQEEVARLAREALERASALDIMGAREQALSESLQDRDDSLTALTAELENARQAVSDASELMKKKMEHAQEVLHTKDTEHQAALASREVLLKDQAACFSSLDTSCKALKEKANSLELELSKSNETHSLLLSQRNSEMEQARKTSSKQAREMDKLRQAEKEKTHELANLRRQVCDQCLSL